MKKTRSPQKSRQTNGPTEADLARLVHIFSSFPGEAVKEAQESALKSTKDFLEGIGRSA